MTNAMTVEIISSYDFGAMFDVLNEVSEEQIGCTFDELSAIVAMQPDDAVAFTAVRELVMEARDRGFVDQAMQMAMTLGAMACTHPHMQELANEVGSMLYSRDGTHLDDDYSDTHAEHHDPKTCKDCKTGRCRRKH